MRAIIYTRVSTQDQAEKGFSLDAQEKECVKFASNMGYEVDKVFIERGESAKTLDRTELNKLIKYAVENKKRVSALIIHKLDRLARNLLDQIQLYSSFNKIGIKVLSATENNEENASGSLNRNILGSFSEYENKLRAERTKNGMMQAVQQGRWCWPAPIGYKWSKNSLNKSILIPSEESKYIVEAFELAKSGLYKQTEIAAILKRKGFKKAKAALLNKILKNPLYAGLIKVDWFPDDIKANHQAIISEDTFFAVRNILEGKKTKTLIKVRDNPDFPLRRYVRCSKCGGKLTGSWSKGRTKKYPYYHCRTKGCSLNVKKNDLETKYIERLKLLQPKEEILELFEAIILDVWNDKQAERVNEENRLKKELEALEKKRDKIEDLIIDGSFDKETYKRQSKQIKEEIQITKLELNELRNSANYDFEACLDYCRKILPHMADYWDKAENDLKQRFQIIIFPEGISYDGENFGTAKTALIFKNLQSEDLSKYHLAALRGFEPRFDG